MNGIDVELDRVDFFIGGAWAGPKGRTTMDVIEAATEQRIGIAAIGEAVDIDAAVGAARNALDHGPWGRTAPEERAESMRRLADALAARAEATSVLVTRENGMPIKTSRRSNGKGPASLLRAYADLITALPLEEIRKSAMGATVVRRAPVGVVGAITPWNYPQALAMSKIAPALAAGCTIVLKPSPDAALDAYVFADAALEAGLPPGVLNIVLGGQEAGEALVSHPGVDKIAFTGSTAVGRAIAARCGHDIRRVTLELGGKSAAIICDDADLDVVVAGLMGASFRNNSQTCTTQSRILAPHSRYDEVVDAVATLAREMVIGDPLDPSVQCGPMSSRRHRDRVMEYIAAAQASDARLVAGGATPAGLDRGWFVEPTVFADVRNTDRLARDEVFGPVLAVIPYQNDNEAVALANDTEYGLAGSVWTSDERRGLDIARQIRAGAVGVNYFELDRDAPFGGMKRSGIGREYGIEGLESYFELQSIFASDRLLLERDASSEGDPAF
jgi:aldehyde dehydrogenase (NAD+)